MPHKMNPAAGSRQGSGVIEAVAAIDASRPTGSDSSSQHPRVLAEVRKNARELLRLQTAETDDGPRVDLVLFRTHVERLIYVRLVARFRIEMLQDLANGIRLAQRLLGGAP